MITGGIIVEVEKNGGLGHAAMRGDRRVARGRDVPSRDPDHIPDTDKGAKVAAKAGASLFLFLVFSDYL